MADRKKGLGRGLSALLADVGPGDAVASESPPVAPRGPQDRLPIERIAPNPDQPRRQFREEDLAELAASIRERGIIQPIIVRPAPSGDGSYQIVAGERRWRAAQRAQIHEVPVVIRELDDAEVLEIAIIENIQRADLNPVEEALGYRQLMDRFGHTQEKLAEGLGKSRPYIANLLRLLSLPEPVLEMLRQGDLSAGHARAIVPAEDPVALAREIVAKGLSVRAAEALARAGKSGDPGGGEGQGGASRGKPQKDADTRAIEADLSAALRMKVSIDPHKDGEGGQLSIRYRSLDELDALLQLLAQ